MKWYLSCYVQVGVDKHYGDVIMGAIASQITSLTIVYSTDHSEAHQRKHQRSASLASVRGIHRGAVNSPAQMASNAENVSIWWRHHEYAVPATDQSQELYSAVVNITHYSWLGDDDQGPFSISNKTSYLKISWSLEAARFVVLIFTSL